ncbi:MAG: site-2 protease family protein [Kiritimatiellales bacterium]|nr:site-2 protease family protein [Kiritimatiellota bacterium]MBL7012591.1 site-2 protease family protein [Kiritimatiellales bacterium]
MFIQTFFKNPTYYLLWVVFAAFSICVHEYAHAYTAVRYGDDTPREHLTLNPLKQMGPVSLLMLVLIGIAWGAVPVSPHGTGSARKDAMISFAGPFANLILCAVFALLAVVAYFVGQEGASELLSYGGYVNGALFVFNLLPLPPLDGFSIVRALVPQVKRYDLQAQQFLGIFFLLFWLTPLGSVIFLVGNKLFGLFLVLWALPAGFLKGLLSGG